MNIILFTLGLGISNTTLHGWYQTHPGMWKDFKESTPNLVCVLRVLDVCSTPTSTTLSASTFLFNHKAEGWEKVSDQIQVKQFLIKFLN